MFPEIFKEHEKVRVISHPGKEEECVGWIFNNHKDHEWFIKHATMPNSMDDYCDAHVYVEYWDEEYLEWGHMHVSPIYLERVNEKKCNCFDYDEKHQVIIGHDSGAALWIHVADVRDSDKILTDDVTELGLEISVYESFFDDIVRPIFVDVFDPEMPLNRHRFTYGMRDEGQYLHRFEERILEYNFFTYDQVKEIIERIEDLVKDGSQRIEHAIGGTDAIQLVTLAAHLRHIMEQAHLQN